MNTWCVASASRSITLYIQKDIQSKLPHIQKVLFSTVIECNAARQIQMQWQIRTCTYCARAAFTLSLFLWNGIMYSCFVANRLRLRMRSIVATLTLFTLTNVPWSAKTASLICRNPMALLATTMSTIAASCSEYSRPATSVGQCVDSVKIVQ